MDCSPWGQKRVKHDLVAKQQQHGLDCLITLSVFMELLLCASVAGRLSDQGLNNEKALTQGDKRGSLLLSRFSRVRLCATP